MSIAAVLGFSCQSYLTFRRPLIYCSHKVLHRRNVAAVELPPESVGVIKEEETHVTRSDGRGKADSKAPEWKKLNSKDLGIRTSSMIASPVKYVLNGLKKKGYEVYLVGGCVRDLILKRTPKDFDIITSAELKEVRRVFPRSAIVGRRFPICIVHINDTIVEVSSFSTSGKRTGQKFDYTLRRPPDCDDHDYIRWRNCLQRDFTVNGLMFDPYAKIVYDYIGGIQDIKKAKVRTVIPANVSFVEDCARILRGVRIAARLGFRFSKDMAHSVRELSSTVLRLDKARILMEMNYMLAYGSAEASLRLLWRFGLLEILLPIQAAYLVSQGFRRRDKRSNMLLSLFSNLDKLMAPDRPCHNSLWVGMLAFHKALVDQPRHPLVVAAFSLAVQNGGSLTEAIEIARRITQPHDQSFSELSEPQDIDSDESLIDEIMDLVASLKSASIKMTDVHFVSQAMSKYPQAPYSDLVFIPLASTLRASKIFECVKGSNEKGFIPKKGSKIDYEFLAMGSLQEVRHVFARIVFDTVYPLSLNTQNDFLSQNS